MPTPSRDLTLTRILPVPANKLYRAWTEPAILVQWFTPKPWATVAAELDVRPGGRSFITMRSPEGQDFPNSGVYLEVVPDRKLVFTDAYTTAWEPAEKPFFTGIITFEDLGDGTTRYTAVARHWTVEDCQKHADMGFHDGWNLATDQLLEAASRLADRPA
jgi:uncharacterized protein YndB with AHSA1/START domain